MGENSKVPAKRRVRRKKPEVISVSSGPSVPALEVTSAAAAQTAPILVASEVMPEIPVKPVHTITLTEHLDVLTKVNKDHAARMKHLFDFTFETLAKYHKQGWQITFWRITTVIATASAIATHFHH